jgi:hypothetical protein
MCLVLSLKVGASDTGAMICTDGSVDTQVTPVIVCEVGFPAASSSVTVTLNAAAPGQGMFTQVDVFTAATATHLGVAAEPTVTQRLFCSAAPSEADRPAASAEGV